MALEDRHAAVIISRSLLLRMSIVTDEKVKPYISCWVTFFPPRKIVPLMRKCGGNIVERGRPQMTIWRMRVACRITKAANTRARAHTHTDTHTGCVILIAFPQQQWLHGSSSLLRYTYSVRLSVLFKFQLRRLKFFDLFLIIPCLV